MPERRRYTLRARDRISAARTAEKLHHTGAHLVIPGATVRGALAALWWRDAEDRGEGQQEFTALFDAGLRVGQAVPQPVSDTRPTLLRSVSTYVCKYEPEADCPGFALDMALELIAGRPTDEPACGGCGGPTRTRPGWQWGHQPTRTIRTALEADGTAKAGNLFSREAAPAGLTFTGWLTVPDGADLSWLEQGELRVGGKRTVMGAASITTASVDDTTEHVHGAVALRLRSPAIIVDRFGAASLAEADVTADLQRVAQSPGLSVRRSWPRSELVTGWHMQSGLPKPADWALSAGTSLVVDGLDADGWSRLRASGIGLRTAEGYGELEVIPEPVLAAASGVDAEQTPEPTVSTTAALLDEVVSAFVTGRHQSHLRGAQRQLAVVLRERKRPYPAVAQVIAKALREPWARGLDPTSKGLLRRLLEADDLDADVLNQLGVRITRTMRDAR